MTVLHFSRETDRRRERQARIDKQGFAEAKFHEQDFAGEVSGAEDSPNPHPITVIASSDEEARDIAGQTAERNRAKRRDDGTTFPGHTRGKFRDEVDVPDEGYTDERV